MVRATGAGEREDGMRNLRDMLGGDLDAEVEENFAGAHIERIEAHLLEIV